MRTALAALAASCLTMLCPVASSEAQRPISIGLAGGVSIPEGDLRDGANTGWHALGTVALGTLMQPIGLRLDVAYNRFAFGDQLSDLPDVPGAPDGSVVDGAQTTTSATLNITYRLPMTGAPVSPYLISGLGAYHSACTGDPGCDSTTRYGWNVGLGARLSVLRLRSFVEARYHRTARGEQDVNYFPVTVGVVF